MGKTGTDPVTENGENPLIKKKRQPREMQPINFSKNYRSTLKIQYFHLNLVLCHPVIFSDFWHQPDNINQNWKK